MTTDSKTRYQAVYARHKKDCPVEQDPDARCKCKPSFYGIGWDRSRGRKVRTKRQPTVEAARNALADLKLSLERGETPATRRGIRLSEAREQFVTAAREGRALNKHGRRYKRTAIDVIEGRLKHDIEPVLGRRRLADIRRGDVQALVDELTPVASGSSVRGVVNSLRALYRWAEDRELVGHNPAALVRLPAMNATPIERVASPAEFARLLSVLDLNDAVAYGLAGYGMGRAAQVQRLRWRDVDLQVGAVEWGIDLDARKYEASRRVVPAVPPLLSLLKRAFLEAGRPDGSMLVCLPHYRAAFMSTSGLRKRAKARWADAGLTPITMQECRHSAATWLDSAGVRPKVASLLMGHAVKRQDGAAAITLARYTHVLPEDVERARDQLAAYLYERAQEKTG